MHDDNLWTGPEDIANHLVSHFEKISNTNNNCLNNGLTEETIPSFVDERNKHS